MLDRYERQDELDTILAAWTSQRSDDEAMVMLVVVTSYRQNVRAYPSGGGDYEVATANLGGTAGLVVASALLVDYVMTVAVSVKVLPLVVFLMLTLPVPGAVPVVVPVTGALGGDSLPDASTAVTV